jgi:hypothetical protein
LNWTKKREGREEGFIYMRKRGCRDLVVVVFIIYYLRREMEGKQGEKI